MNLEQIRAFMIVGARVGGYLFGRFGHAGVTRLNLFSVPVSVAGAIVVLVVIMPFGAPPGPKTLRNSRIFLCSMRLVAIASWLMVPCLLILSLAVLFPLRPWSMDKGLGAVSWLGAAFAAGGMGLQMWVWARGMAENQVLLDAAGAHFHFRSDVRGKPRQISVSWHEIESVTRRRDANLMIYKVACQGDRQIVFTQLMFFRAKHVANLIAAGAGKTLTTTPL